MEPPSNEAMALADLLALDLNFNLFSPKKNLHLLVFT